MSEFVSFLMKIAPALVKLGATLWHAFDGDAEAARRNIDDLSEEIARKRAERDRQLDEKHGDGD